MKPGKMREKIEGLRGVIIPIASFSMQADSGGLPYRFSKHAEAAERPIPRGCHVNF
jgi:hypothetical protein